ncbi:hypothetical protein C0J52_11207 [Blattella germanica]|nr:hypothetical protein C0J52_11207 [Blattella germanica]
MFRVQYVHVHLQHNYVDKEILIEVMYSSLCRFEPGSCPDANQSVVDKCRENKVLVILIGFVFISAIVTEMEYLPGCMQFNIKLVLTLIFKEIYRNYKHKQLSDTLGLKTSP